MEAVSGWDDVSSAASWRSFNWRIVLDRLSQQALMTDLSAARDGVHDQTGYHVGVHVGAGATVFYIPFAILLDLPGNSYGSATV